MKIGAEGLKLIKEFEGCKLISYKCPAGVWTIGIGSTRYTDGSPVKANQALPNEGAALMLLTKTVAAYEHTVNTVGVELTQNEYDALVSLCYNIGSGNFVSSTLVKMLKAGEPKSEVAKQFLRWDKAGGKPLAGLTRRRNAEAELFLKQD
jgi:GH24 family phage-related lysozyme (muramidase)